mmetsp:Transcript_8545/g.14882  ORF Transcript_8545/g.14882 Transcript_8545/m.14882 type:complete len:435 (+) Transcript_8545:67-1371(+)
MGAVAGHIPDCAPDRSRECTSALTDDCEADCEASQDDYDGSDRDVNLEEISIRGLTTRLFRLASAEGGTKHSEIYQESLAHVLSLCMVHKGAATSADMTACVFVVAPQQELSDVQFRVKASSCSALAGSLTGMEVNDADFEQTLEKLLSQQAVAQQSFASVAEEEPSTIVLTVDFSSGMVGTSLVAESVDPFDIAGKITRGVVFSRSCRGNVCVYPAADVQRGQAWQVVWESNAGDEPIDFRMLRAARAAKTLRDQESLEANPENSTSKRYHSIDCVYEDKKTGGKVYVGGHVAAKNLKLLQKYKISKIVNCQDITSENFFEERNGFGYLRFPLTSWSSAPNAATNAGVLRFFNPLFRFVDGALDKGDNVLIHCFAGAYRSGTAAAAVLMHRTTYSSTEALRELQRKRPVVNTILDLGELLTRLDCALERTVVL